MIYTILGYNQMELCKLNITVSDALILKYVADFIDSGKMVTLEHNKEKYYWIDYKSLIASLPILNIKKDTLYRRLKELVKIGVLKHYTKREGGTYSFYALGEKYKELTKKFNSDEEKNVNNQENIDGNKMENNYVNSDSDNNSSDVECVNEYVNKQDSLNNINDIDNDEDTCIDCHRECKSKSTYDKLGKPRERTTDELYKKGYRNNSRGKENNPRSKNYYNKGTGKSSKEVKERNTRSYGKNYGTKDYLIKDYKINNYKINNKSKEIGELRGFNNFIPREYDYDELERRLLGWD